MPKYRVIEKGVRRLDAGMMKGIVIVRGWDVEKWDAEINQWVYVDCLHPDDAVQFLNK